MQHHLLRNLLLLVFLISFFTLQPTQAQHQPENNNWNFGNFNGLSFGPTGPVYTTSSRMSSSEAVSTISDAQGNLLFYSNGCNVWDRSNTPLPSTYSPAGELNGHRSTTQGALFVKDPAPGSTRYYLFTLDTYEEGPNQGLNYTVLDLTLRNGLGDIAPGGKNVPLPVGPPNLLTEKMVGVRHNNGRDTWIIVHGVQNNSFYSFLVTPTGVNPVPVISRVGQVHNEWVGQMKVSPDGRKLALGIALARNSAELLDFNNATGEVSNAVLLNSGSSWNYGTEFSPDNSKLYVFNYPNFADPTAYTAIRQYNLLAGSPAAIVSTAVDIPLARAPFMLSGMELGPDGKLYISRGPSEAMLTVINAPNELGLACSLQINGFALGPMHNTGNLQNFVRVPPMRLPELLITGSEVCQGSPSAFTGTLTLPLPLSNIRWNFGDPASGAANTATGLTPTHVFSAPGSYTVTLQADAATGGTPAMLPLSATYTVSVRPSPVLRLNVRATDTTVCFEKPLALRVLSPATGATYRWQDGSTADTYSASQAGRYAVEVSQAGCTSRAEIELRNGCPVLIPNIITPNGDGANDFLALKGLSASQWNLRIYNRWGREVYRQAGYANNWSASGQPDGLYYYLLTNPTDGRSYRGYVEVLR